MPCVVALVGAVGASERAEGRWVVRQGGRLCRDWPLIGVGLRAGAEGLCRCEWYLWATPAAGDENSQMVCRDGA
jgi:hypothetical protein